MKKVLLILFVLIGFVSYGQNDYLDSLNNYVQTSQNDTNKLLTFLKIGDYYEYTQPDSALFFYEKAEDIAKQCSCMELLVRTLNYQAITLIDNSKYPEAILVLDSALQLTKDSLQIIYLKNNLATIYINIGLFEQAFEIYIEQLAYFVEHDDLSGLATSYSNFSAVFNELGEKDSVLFYNQKALSVDIQLQDSVNIVFDYLNLGIALSDLGNYSEAEEYLKKSELLAKTLQLNFVLADIYSAFAGLFAYQSNFGKAIGYSRRSLYVNKIFEDYSAIINNYIDLYNYFEALNRFPETENYIDTISFIFNSYKDDLSIIDKQRFFKIYYSYFERINNIDSAFYYYKKYIYVSDSISTSTQADRIKVLQAQMQIDKTTSLLDEYKNNAKRNNRLLVMYFIIIIGALFSLLIVGITLFRLKKATKILRKNKEELEQAALKRRVQVTLFQLQKKAANFKEEEHLDDILQILLEDILEISWLKLKNKGIIYLTNSEGNLYQSATVNIGETAQKCAIIKPGECLCGTVLQNKQKIIETEVNQNHTISTVNMKQHGHYIEAIISDNKTIGVLTLYLSNNQNVEDIVLEFLHKFSVLLATVIDKRQRMEKLAENVEKQDKLNQKLFAQSLILEQQKIKVEKFSKKLEEQSKILEQTLFDLQSSVNYASYIVNSMLPSDEYLDNLFKEYFLVFKPVQKIGGDFYYAKKMGEKILIAVGDATGHGISGAFLATQAITFIRGMVNRGEALEPADILTQLRVKIKRIFKYSTNESLKFSGLDIAFCVLDTTLNTITFAGAYMPLTVVRNKEIIKIKGTRNPIGAHIKEYSFQQHSLDLKNNDVIYLGSDGYSDQLGGENHLKLSRKTYEEFLLEISNKPIDEQKNLLEMKFENWKGNTQQIDDITILGIKWKYKRNKNLRI